MYGLAIYIPIYHMYAVTMVTWDIEAELELPEFPRKIQENNIPVPRNSGEYQSH